MKCKNCGINFDDGDRACPMCGTAAGAGKKAFIPRYTDYTHRDHMEGDCTHRTFTTKFTTTGQNKSEVRAQAAARSAKAQKKQDTGKKAVGWIYVLVIVFVLLMQLLPTFAGQVKDAIERWTYGIAERTPDVPIPEEDWDAYDSTDDYEIMRVHPRELFSAVSLAETTDGGTLTLTTDEDENYRLTYEGAWSYEAEGWAWCVYNTPEENMYTEPYTPDLYDCFSVCLTIEASTYGGDLPAGAAEKRETNEMWMIVYRSMEDGTLTIEDAYGECAAFFGGEQFIELKEVQAG